MNHFTHASLVNINLSRLSEINVRFNSFTEGIFSATSSHFIIVDFLTILFVIL
jgi:hypothetical protein